MVFSHALHANIHIPRTAQLVSLSPFHTKSLISVSSTSAHSDRTCQELATLKAEAADAEASDTAAHPDGQAEEDEEQDAVVPSVERRMLLTALCEAFMNCQAAQARAIDAAYGRLSGRDRGLSSQVRFQPPVNEDCYCAA